MKRTIQKTSRMLLIVIPAILLAMTVIENGERQLVPKKGAQAVVRQEELNSKTAGLYEVYLTGNTEEARKALLDTVQLVENSGQTPYVQALYLFYNNARLYVLETRSGNDDIAEAYLVKARYWHIKQSESHGDSIEKAGKAVKAFDGAKCLEFVDTWDKGRTYNHGPNYAATRPTTRN